MQEMTVKYLLTDEEVERLEKITEKYNGFGFQKQGQELTIESLFETIMCMGSRYDIDSKFKFHEWKLGLREDFK